MRFRPEFRSTFSQKLVPLNFKLFNAYCRREAVMRALTQARHLPICTPRPPSRRLQHPRDWLSSGRLLCLAYRIHPGEGQPSGQPAGNQATLYSGRSIPPVCGLARMLYHRQYGGDTGNGSRRRQGTKSQMWYLHGQSVSGKTQAPFNERLIRDDVSIYDSTERVAIHPNLIRSPPLIALT